MSIRLTDDEIVYAAVSRKHAWPLPLPTVDMEGDALREAGARGARSLVVRDLATPQKDSPHVLDEMIATVVDRVGTSTQRILAHFADPAHPALLTGRSFSLSIAADDPELATSDVVSANGIHELENLSREAGEERFLTAVERVFTGGLDAVDEQENDVLVISSTVGDQVLIASEGRIERGTVNTIEGVDSIELAGQLTGWDRKAILHAVGLS